MAVLLAQRCLHHSAREAVARCPECGEFYCRECITEHDDRVICSACLKKMSRSQDARRRDFAPALRLGAALSGVLLAWIFFFLIGRLLVNIPSSFHEGTVWERPWLESEEP